MSTEYFCYTIFARFIWLISVYVVNTVNVVCVCECLHLMVWLQNIIGTLRIRCTRMFDAGECDNKMDNTADQRLLQLNLWHDNNNRKIIIPASTNEYRIIRRYLINFFSFELKQVTSEAGNTSLLPNTSAIDVLRKKTPFIHVYQFIWSESVVHDACWFSRTNWYAEHNDMEIR